jgi:hypothetical protein
MDFENYIQGLSHAVAPRKVQSRLLSKSLDMQLIAEVSGSQFPLALRKSESLKAVAD